VPLPSAVVAHRSFDVRLETIGVLDAERSFQVVSQLPGEGGKIVDLVEDGARVAQGDLLVRFEPSSFQAEVARLNGDLASRQAAVEALRQNLELEKAQGDKALTGAQFELKLARQEHQRYLAYIDDLERLRAQGTRVDNEIAQAQRKSEQMLTGLQKLESDFTRQQREVGFRVGHAEAELHRAQSEAATAQDALARARLDLARTEVRSPVAGFAVLHEVFFGNQKRKPRAGDTVFQGQPLLYLPDLSALVVKTQLREEDLHKLARGEHASVRVDAFPDALFEGEVANIGVLAVEAAEAATAGKHFQYTVSVAGHDSRLRPGMTARVSLLAAHLTDVATVPLTALFLEGDRYYCYRAQGEGFERVAVAVGASNEDSAEIRSGLVVGDRVSLVKP
jgi:HlyD family secretion protein